LSPITGHTSSESIGCMSRNSVLGKLINGGDPNQLSREIVWALAEARKVGYEVIFEETGGDIDHLTITFSREVKTQRLVIPGYVWRHVGGIRQAILDDLKI
jgi:hypothetical protein